MPLGDDREMSLMCTRRPNGTRTGHLWQSHKGCDHPHFVLAVLFPHFPLVHLTSELLLVMSNGFQFGTYDAVLPGIESLGYNFLAPYALALFISAIETGVIVVCFTRFLARRADVEATPIKLLVYFLTCASL